MSVVGEENYLKIEKFAVFELHCGPRELLDLITQFVDEWQTEIDQSFYCMDCRVDTRLDPLDYYMVHDSLWLSVVPGDRGMLCLACLSERLGRPLTDEDFTEYPINSMRKPMNSQKLPSKPCRCGEGRVYTGDHAKHNAVVDGKQVCPGCYVRSLYAKHLDRKD